MSFEEFKELALNPPRLDEETIFQVMEYTVNSYPGCNESPYPKFSLSHRLIGLSHSISKAERLIEEAIANNKKYRRESYCFYIKEIPVGLYFGSVWDDEYISLRLYNSDGQFLNRSYCSTMSREIRSTYNIFRGRPSEAIRFNEGDIVEVRNGNIVHLSVVASAPLSIERAWELKDKHKTTCSGPFADSVAVITDDKKACVFPFDVLEENIIDNNTSSYPQGRIPTLNILPLHYPLPATLRKKYKEIYQELIRAVNNI